MEGKTKVIVTYNYQQQGLNDGDIGYIDGYIVLDDMIKAIVVVGDKIYNLDIFSLNVIL
jgi:hypothetical protein